MRCIVNNFFGNTTQTRKRCPKLRAKSSVTIRQQLKVVSELKSLLSLPGFPPQHLLIQWLQLNLGQPQLLAIDPHQVGGSEIVFAG